LESAITSLQKVNIAQQSPAESKTPFDVVWHTNAQVTLRSAVFQTGTYNFSL
jgi:hypothetical protein